MSHATIIIRTSFTTGTDVKNHGIPHTITSQFKELTTLPARTDVDNYDIEELYEFADATGILERHKALLSQPFNESQVRHHNHKDHIILSLTDFRWT